MLCSDGVLIILRDGVLGSGDRQLASRSSLVSASCRNIDDVAAAAATDADTDTVQSMAHISMKDNNGNSKDDGDIPSGSDSGSCRDSYIVMGLPCASTTLSISTSVSPVVTTSGSDDFVNISIVDKDDTSSSSSLIFSQVSSTTRRIEAKIDDVVKKIDVEDSFGQVQGVGEEEREGNASHSISSSSLPLISPNWPLGIRVNVGRNLSQRDEDEKENGVGNQDSKERKFKEIPLIVQTLRLGSWLIRITRLEIADDIENNESIKKRGNTENAEIENESSALLMTANNRDSNEGHDSSHKSKKIGENSKTRIRVLQSVKDIFPGQFHYYLKLPAYCSELVVLSDQVSGSDNQSRGQKVQESKAGSSREKEKSNGVAVCHEVEKGNNTELKLKLDGDTNEQKKQQQQQEQEHEYPVGEKREEVILEAPALNGIDPRLKAGLPLFVPIAFKDDIILHSNVNLLGNSENELILCLEYSFVRTGADCIPSM